MIAWHGTHADSHLTQVQSTPAAKHSLTGFSKGCLRLAVQYTIPPMLTSAAPSFSWAWRSIHL
jgi:hypothetical protein